MFDSSLYLLVKEHERELREAAGRRRPEWRWTRQADERQQRRADAARRLLSSINRRV